MITVPLTLDILVLLSLDAKSERSEKQDHFLATKNVARKDKNKPTLQYFYTLPLTFISEEATDLSLMRRGR